MPATGGMGQGCKKQKELAEERDGEKVHCEAWESEQGKSERGWFLCLLVVRERLRDAYIEEKKTILF